MSSGSSPPLQPQLSIQHPVGPPTTSPRSPHASLSQHMTVCLHRCPPPVENCLSFMTLLTCHFSCLFHLTSLSPLRLDIPLIYNPDHNVLSLFVHVSVFPTPPLPHLALLGQEVRLIHIYVPFNVASLQA